MFSGEGKDQLLKAFVSAQAKFDVPKRTKTAKVQTRTGGNYEYKYSTLDELIAATRPALTEFGLACFNNVVMPGGNVVTVSCVLVHGESGQSHESEPLIFQVDGSPQATGAAITYGRRYSMSALLGVAAEDDVDAPNHAIPQPQQQARAVGRKPQTQAPKDTPEPDDSDTSGEQPITPAQLERLRRIVKEAGVKGADMAAWLRSMDIPSSDAIKRSQYQNIVLAVQGGKVPAQGASASA